MLHPSLAPSTPRVAHGIVEEVVYRNTFTGYTVLTLIDDTTHELVTAVGSMPFVSEGEIVSLWGTWTKHPEYGKQLAVTAYDKELPTKSADILRYLSSKSIKGVGPATALKIVNRFGAETFDVLESHPEWLSDIPGITRKKAAAIGRAFAEQAQLRDLMTLCAGYISSPQITRVFETWGDNAVSFIRQDPYRLCKEVHGIPFDRADELAKQLGIADDDPIRVRAAILYVLRNAASVRGHTCLPREELVDGVTEKAGLTEERVREGIETALREGSIVLRTWAGRDLIYTKENDEAEQTVTRKLFEIRRNAVTFSRENLLRLMDRMEDSWGIEYARKQREAIGTALSGGVMILTGGPGTGKTTVIRALLYLFETLEMKTLLLAPTGRAAKRMSEATVHEAKTVHRALEMTRAVSTGVARFQRDEENPLDEMAVIVDESSMIDLPLMDSLLRAMKRGSHLILVGDADQLPSVGCGNVLADLIASGEFPVVRLDEVFRQSESSRIVTNAHRINEGKMPVLTDKTGDFFFLSRTDDFATVDTLLSLVRTRLPRAYGQGILEKIQVITPTRRGHAGTESLNSALQACLNPKAEGKAQFASGEVIYRVGDRVMQTRNNYDLLWEKDGNEGYGIFNGDMGIITEIDNQEKRFTVSYEERLVTYDMTMVDEIEHAYAITVHKSQGSEYPVVIMPVCACGPLLQTRNLLYTALTRAKETVILVGREEIVAQMVANDHRAERYTTLSDRLKIGDPFSV